MARKERDLKRFIHYSDGHGGLTAFPFEGKVLIDTAMYEGFGCSPNQARHIAKKLNQFADDIEIAKKGKE
jgi:hypothetical protein